MDFLTSFRISASGLAANRKRMAAINSNIANVDKKEKYDNSIHCIFLDRCKAAPLNKNKYERYKLALSISPLSRNGVNAPPTYVIVETIRVSNFNAKK